MNEKSFLSTISGMSGNVNFENFDEKPDFCPGGVFQVPPLSRTFSQESSKEAPPGWIFPFLLHDSLSS
jgi:hypothetical protein